MPPREDAAQTANQKQGRAIAEGISGWSCLSAAVAGMFVGVVGVGIVTVMGGFASIV